MMQIPVQITVKDLNISKAIHETVQQKADKLQQFFKDIISCHVVLEQTQKHKQRGKLNNVRINIGVPGKELIVNNNENEDLRIAIRDAFENAQRQLEDYARKIHGNVKSHPDVLHGKIVRLFDDFGFIEDHNGLEYYFNANNLLHAQFEKLNPGCSVQFIEAMGDEGPQAHRVTID